MLNGACMGMVDVVESEKRAVFLEMVVHLVVLDENVTQAQVLEQVLEPLVRDDPLRPVFVEDVPEEMGVVEGGCGEDATAQHAPRCRRPVGPKWSKEHVSEDPILPTTRLAPEPSLAR